MANLQMRFFSTIPNVNKELQIWEFVLARLMRGENVMLLVVAESSGSSPGRQGYKMVVGADGELFGSIGGGVMEVNLVETSRRSLSELLEVTDGSVNKLAEQVHRKNVENSSGMICSGKQTVLFKLVASSDREIVQQIVKAIEERRREMLVITPSSISIENSTEIASDFRFEKQSDTDFEYNERLGPKNDLYIIGGGHCALALSELMSRMDLHISIFDDRPDLNTIQKNEFADKINVIENYEHIAEHIPSSRTAYVVVMTLGYKSDAAVIRSLIEKDFKYFGVLGSKAKMATLMKELKDEGLPAEKLDQIHTPVGLPINSRTPEEIAVSIAAEIIAVKNGVA